jgi:thiamine-phosphate pyrophosphorylase
MKLIVISPASAVPNEHEIITSLFEEGLEIFHIHKPDFSKEEIKHFVQQIPFKYHDRIALHSAFPKFHSLQELEACSLPGGEGWGGAEYAFLSPIFDSISKVGYKSKFSDRMNKFLKMQPGLLSAIRGKNIIALGGIDEDKIVLARKIGFTGVAVLGAIWNSKDPLGKFKRIKAKCQKKDLVF